MQALNAEPTHPTNVSITSNPFHDEPCGQPEIKNPQPSQNPYLPSAPVGNIVAPPPSYEEATVTKQSMV